MLVAVARSPPVASTRLSDGRYATPEAESAAPPVPDELSQPRSLPLGGFEHGQAITPPAPGSQRLASGEYSRSRTNTSSRPLSSPGTRSAAALQNATQRPSAE